MFCTIQLAGSIDPATMTTSSSLSVKVPFAGYVRIGDLSGSLLDNGVSLNIDTTIARGKVTLNAQKSSDSSGAYNLYIQLALDVKLVGKIDSGNYPLVQLP